MASGYSLQYGASHPQTLVERAVEQEMDTLALTDRDGTYGAVNFTQACKRAGIRPVLGVDLAVAPVGLQSARQEAARSSQRTPVRGGAHRDLPAHRGGSPRVTFLATGKAGWSAICRMVSATHLTGERGRPVATLETLAPYLMGGDVMVLLGPYSEIGVAARRRRDDLAIDALAPWRDIVPRDNLIVELVSHRRGRQHELSVQTAARMAGIARRAELGTVLTNAVRYADRLDAPTVDVLDAARRLVALDRRHVDRGNAEGFLKSGKQMHEMAEEICRLSGLSNNTEMAARQLLAQTRAVADRCALDPRGDLGIGEVHFPEFQLSGGGATPVAQRTGCCAPAATQPSAAATARRRASASGSASTTSSR